MVLNIALRVRLSDFLIDRSLQMYHYHARVQKSSKIRDFCGRCTTLLVCCHDYRFNKIGFDQHVFMFP